MALDNFIPSLWAGTLLANLRKALVYGQTGVVNRNYEGEIREMGDSVRINMIGPVTISSYTKNSDMASPETLTDAQTVLVIDQGRYFNFQIDDVDRAQQNPDVMNEAMTEAGYGLADTADQYLAALMAAAVAAGNLIGSVGSPKTDLGTAANAYNYLVDLDVKLSENNVPKAGRWVIVPPWFHGVLRKDDRFVKQVTPLGTEALLNGVVGRAAGFDVIESNNVVNDSGTKYRIIAGYGGAVTMAEQILKMEAYRPEKRFADAVKGLHVYGAKVVRPSALAMLIANKPS